MISQLRFHTFTDQICYCISVFTCSATCKIPWELWHHHLALRYFRSLKYHSTWYPKIKAIRNQHIAELFSNHTNLKYAIWVRFTFKYITSSKVNLVHIYGVQWQCKFSVNWKGVLCFLSTAVQFRCEFPAIAFYGSATDDVILTKHVGGASASFHHFLFGPHACPKPPDYRLMTF